MGAESKYDAEGKLIEEAKGSCGARFSQAVSAAWKSKPPSEWGQMVFCFLIFYLFMTAWMAVHMYVMVYNMPDLVVYTQHGMELGEPRNTRFNVDGLYLANHVGDDVIDLVSAPWDAARSDKYNLDSRYVVCNTGKFCSSSQQLRTLNQFRNRWLSADLPAQCYVKEVRVDGTVTTSDQANLTVSFSSFTDPYNASRTFENAATHVQMCKNTEPFKFGPGRENANAGVYPENCPQKLVRADGTNEWQGTLDSKLPYTHSYGEEDNALPWDNTTQPIAWLENSNLPHIVQYNLNVKINEDENKTDFKVAVDVTCFVEINPVTMDAFQFDDNLEHESTELARIEGIPQVEYTYTFDFGQ